MRSKRRVLGQEEALDERLGARLRTLRLERNFSQEVLSDQIGCSFQQLQKYERGDNRVSVSRLFTILNALRVSVQDVLVELDKERPIEPVHHMRSSSEVLSLYAGLQPHQRRTVLDLMKSLNGRADA